MRPRGKNSRCKTSVKLFLHSTTKLIKTDEWPLQMSSTQRLNIQLETREFILPLNGRPQTAQLYVKHLETRGIHWSPAASCDRGALKASVWESGTLLLHHLPLWKELSGRCERHKPERAVVHESDPRIHCQCCISGSISPSYLQVQTKLSPTVLADLCPNCPNSIYDIIKTTGYMVTPKIFKMRIISV